MFSPPQAHGVLELFFLLLLAADISLRLLWLQPRHFLQHKRTMLIVSRLLYNLYLCCISYPLAMRAVVREIVRLQ